MNPKLKKYVNTIAILLFAILATYITYSKNKPIHKNELISFSGNLKEIPYEGKQGGDMPEPFIRLILENSDRKYILMWCSYSVADVKSILALNAGTNVNLSYKKQDKDRNQINVYNLKSNDKTLIYLEEFNRCYTEAWKGLLIFIYVIFMILSVMLITDIWKYFTHTKKTTLRE